MKNCEGRQVLPCGQVDWSICVLTVSVLGMKYVRVITHRLELSSIPVILPLQSSL